MLSVSVFIAEFNFQGFPCNTEKQRGVKDCCSALSPNFRTLRYRKHLKIILYIPSSRGSLDNDLKEINAVLLEPTPVIHSANFDMGKSEIRKSPLS